MATNSKPLSIVLTYSAETEAINIQSVSTSEIASATARTGLPAGTVRLDPSGRVTLT